MYADIVCPKCNGEGRVLYETGRAAFVSWATPHGIPEEKEEICDCCNGEGTTWIEVTPKGTLSAPDWKGIRGDTEEADAVAHLLWLKKNEYLSDEDFIGAIDFLKEKVV